MIQCPNCETNNPSGRDICEECGAQLLPGEGIGDRLGNLIVGILGGIMAGAGAYVLVEAQILPTPASFPEAGWIAVPCW